LRWRPVDHSALDDPWFRAGLGRFTLPEEAGGDLRPARSKSCKPA
jgi:hypothetical protein